MTPYLICAGFIGAVTLYMFFLYFKDVISKISTSHEDTIDNRNCSKCSIISRNTDTDLIILMVWVWSIYISSKEDDEGFSAVRAWK